MSWFFLLVLACTDPTVAPDPVPSPTSNDAVDEPVAPPAPEPLPDPTEPLLSASQVQISWAGTVGADPGLTRTEAEAHALADRLLSQAADGADFASLAREHSSDPSGRRGGGLGVWRTGLMDRDFERCVAAAEVGQLAPLCRTPFGWHVIRRDAVVEAGGSYVVVALPADPEAAAALRTQAEGWRTAWMADRAPAQAVDFAPVGPGQLLAPIDQALFALKPGEVSTVLEAGGALYLVRRAPGS